MPWAALGISAAAGLANYAATASANDKAALLQSQQFQDWMKLHIPDPAEQKVAMQQFVSAGKLAPQLEHAIQQDPSAFQKIVTDSGQKAAQNRALSQLEDIGNDGGLRLQDKAALQDAMMKAQTQERSNREGIQADMARRGLGGSGFDVAAQLQGQQTTADEQSNAGLKAAAAAQDRALQAIQGAGTLATNYRNQDFSEQSAKASAADRINQFNTQNARDVNSANTGFNNRAQELNLANAQKLSDQNTSLSNAEQMYNKGLTQQQFQNQVSQLQGATGQANKVADTTASNGKALGNTISNVGGAAANAATTQANQDFWDNYEKKQKAKAAGLSGGINTSENGSSSSDFA